LILYRSKIPFFKGKKIYFLGFILSFFAQTNKKVKK
jgi:hypothetical protein